MKKKFVESVMVSMLIGAVITGCGKQEESTETVYFSTEPSSESDAEITTEEMESERQTESISEEPTYYHIENPGWDYYQEDKSAVAGEQTLHLEKLGETPNGVSTLEQWLTTNNLDFQEMPYSDENYTYSAYGNNGFDTYELQLQELNGEERTITLDFSDYNYANDFEESERDFVFQRIIWAKAEEDILYVATGHYTYAASSPHNAYITAIDLNDFHVIWKTSPLVCNSLSFEVISDSIVCGYGFTDEDDYLYILDKKTGMVQETIPLKKAAEYIYLKDDTLYVKTYDADLTFKILK